MPAIRSEKSANSRKNIYFRSKEKGVIMPFRCSRCFDKNLECRVLPNSARCGECAKSVGSGDCNVYGHSAGNWARVEREEARLEAEEEAAAKLEQEAFARRMRIRKQQKILREKAGKMLQHDLHTVEALEKFEAEEQRLENERVEKEKEAASASAAGPSDGFFDSSSLDPSILASMESPSFWADPGIAGEMPPTSQGS